MEENNTFIRITNKMIYDEIVNLKTHVKVTNGKVIRNTESNKNNTSMNKLNLTLIIIMITAILGMRFF